MTLFDMLSGTPTWVWAAFAYVVYKGINAFKPHTKALWTQFVVPAIFLYLGAVKLPSYLPLGWLGIPVWAGTLVIGALIGWFVIMTGSDIQVDRVKQLIHLPGDKTLLPIVLSIFAVKYYFGFMSATHPELAQQLSFVMSNLILSALLLGLLIGKATYIVHAYFTLPQIGLREE
jgi:hypothetical protein